MIRGRQLEKKAQEEQRQMYSPEWLSKVRLGDSGAVPGLSESCGMISFDVPNDPDYCNDFAEGNFSSFFIDATFSPTCECCEYRQYVRGWFFINGNYWPNTLYGGNTLSPSVFYEDGCADGAYAYGHRDAAHECGGGHYSGCSYSASDQPGVQNLSSGDTYEYYLDFYGVIINNCVSPPVQLAYRSWSIECSGTVA